jgi:hypothetical protein
MVENCAAGISEISLDSSENYAKTDKTAPQVSVDANACDRYEFGACASALASEYVNTVSIYALFPLSLWEVAGVREEQLIHSLPLRNVAPSP